MSYQQATQRHAMSQEKADAKETITVKNNHTITPRISLKHITNFSHKITSAERWQQSVNVECCVRTVLRVTEISG